MIPSDVVVNLSGPQRIAGVRIIDGQVYGEAKTHRGGQPTSDPAVVRIDVALPQGDAEELRAGKRWALDGWVASKAGGCSCRGSFAALRAFVP